MSRKGPVKPPDWWNESLYDFLKDMPLEGWIWEFYRRAVLKENLGDLPVDAMNPEPDLERVLAKIPYPEMLKGWELSIVEEEDLESDNPILAPFNWDLYLPWNHARWDTRKPIGMPPPVRCHEVPQLQRWFGRHYEAGRKLIGTKHVVKKLNVITLGLNLDCRNSRIREHFELVLMGLRQTYPEPKKAPDRTEKWLDNKILQVWDLRELKVGLETITKMLFLKNDYFVEPKKARNAHASAVRLIEKEGWLKLALRADFE